MIDKYQRIWESLKDVEYRREYSADIGTGLAFQIKLLREKNGWTQDRLAGLTGKQQETISQWENPDYGNYTLNTLKSLASAFDVALIVKFAPFSELAKWMSALTPERLAPPSFGEEAQAAGRLFAETFNHESDTVQANADVDTIVFSAEELVSASQPGLDEPIKTARQKGEDTHALAA